jgi:hypothetical protein
MSYLYGPFKRFFATRSACKDYLHFDHIFLNFHKCVGKRIYHIHLAYYRVIPHKTQTRKYYDLGDFHKM